MTLTAPFNDALRPIPAFFSQAPRRIGGVDVTSVTAEEARRILSMRLDAGLFTSLAFLNAHCVNVAFEREDYRHALERFVVLPDGIGIDLASQLLYGSPFPANLNGTDFVPYLLKATRRSLSVALLGAAPGVADRAAAGFAAASPQHRFHVISHGFFADGPETTEVVARLRDLKPDVVLVALAVPRQELFVAEHLSERECTLAIGVGALFDFVGAIVPRAPLPVRWLRMEWLYRLAIEPKRLWRRYILGNPIFIARMFGERRRAGERERS